MDGTLAPHYIAAATIAVYPVLLATIVAMDRSETYVDFKLLLFGLLLSSTPCESLHSYLASSSFPTSSVPVSPSLATFVSRLLFHLTEAPVATLAILRRMLLSWFTAV